MQRIGAGFGGAGVADQLVADYRAVYFWPADRAGVDRLFTGPFSAADYRAGSVDPAGDCSGDWLCLVWRISGRVRCDRHDTFGQRIGGGSGGSIKTRHPSESWGLGRHAAVTQKLAAWAVTLSQRQRKHR